MAKVPPVLIAILLVLQVSAQNFCGTSYSDASKCQTSCPGGVDGECPTGESCFASVRCTPSAPNPTSGNFCGTSYSDASKCQTSCPGGMDRECPGGESCFALVSCSAAPPTSPPSDGSFIVSEAQYRQFFPERLPVYSYGSLVSAARAFPAFANTGGPDVRVREAAAFLANVAHESGFLRYNRELNQANWNSYCDPGTAQDTGFSADCRKNGRTFQYYGRGPMQLSWNFNYRVAGAALQMDLLHNPDRVADDGFAAWSTAIWFWMTSQGAGVYTPHVAITTGRGFGHTVRSINGALECDGKRPNIVQTRAQYFNDFLGRLGGSAGPGNLLC